MKTNLNVISLCAAVLFSAPFVATSQVTTLYSDDFSGLLSVELGGTTPDTTIGTNTWFNANGDNSSSFQADGSVVAGSAASGIWLPVDINAGNIYTLSADVDLTSTGSTWISLGYAQFASDAAFGGSGGYGTVIVNPGSVRPFAGLGTAGGGGFYTAAGFAPQQLSIVLDASDANSANWTMEFFENGVSLEGPVTTTGDFGNINNIGFTTVNGTATGTIDNFSFTVTAVPEPSTYALLAGVLTLGLVILRRRRF